MSRSASSPSSTRSAWYWDSSSPRRMYWPTTRSSSTMRIFTSDSDRDGQEDPEDAALPLLGVHLDPAQVLLHDAVADRETQAGAPPRRLGGVERLEDLGQVAGCGVAPGILDRYHHVVGVLPAERGAHHHGDAVVQRVHHVQHQGHQKVKHLL